jgi:hypothetical protein
LRTTLGQVGSEEFSRNFRAPLKAKSTVKRLQGSKP